MKYTVTLKPGGVIPRDLDMGLTMQRVADFQDKPKIGDRTMPFMGVSAWADTVQLVPASEALSVAYNQELYDTNGMHDPDANPNRLIIPDAGKWQAFWRGGIKPTGGDEDGAIVWRLNDAIDLVVLDLAIPNGVRQYVQLPLPPVALAAGDYLTVVIQNNQDLEVGETMGYPHDPTIPAPDIGDAPWAVVWRVGV